MAKTKTPATLVATVNCDVKSLHEQAANDALTSFRRRNKQKSDDQLSLFPWDKVELILDWSTVEATDIAKVAEHGNCDCGQCESNLTKHVGATKVTFLIGGTLLNKPREIAEVIVTDNYAKIMADPTSTEDEKQAETLQFYGEVRRNINKVLKVFGGKMLAEVASASTLAATETLGLDHDDNIDKGVDLLLSLTSKQYDELIVDNWEAVSKEIISSLKSKDVEITDKQARELMNIFFGSNDKYALLLDGLREVKNSDEEREQMQAMKEMLMSALGGKKMEKKIGKALKAGYEKKRKSKDDIADDLLN